MDATSDLKSASKFLSYVLRHHPEEISLTIDKHGWISIDQLVNKSKDSGRILTRDLIRRIITQGSKQRFVISDNGNRIRAAYGHSINIDLQLKPENPPHILYHGTARKNLTSILNEGIKPKDRNLVHLSGDNKQALQVGARHGTPEILTIEAGAMAEEGFDFYRSESEKQLWLTEHIPVRFLST